MDEFYFPKKGTKTSSRSKGLTRSLTIKVTEETHDSLEQLRIFDGLEVSEWARAQIQMGLDRIRTFKTSLKNDT